MLRAIDSALPSGVLRAPATSGLAIALGLLALAACGGDDSGNPPPKPANPGAPGAPAAPGAAGAKNPLPERVKIEDVVRCDIPDKPTDPKDGKCDPKAPDCPEHTYCLQLAQGTFCEACPERDSIRHPFKERDFAVEGNQNRDPFQSFLLPQLSPLVGKSDQAVPIDPTKKCIREDQMIATSFSYSELKLVGIVAQGTQRKVLMMGGPLGYIIKRGDCVGKEKAVVKDIGAGYITFLVDPEVASQKTPNEYSVQLHPQQLSINSQPSEQPIVPKSPAPVVPPPSSSLPPKPGSGSAAPNVPIEAPPKL